MPRGKAVKKTKAPRVKVRARQVRRRGEPVQAQVTPPAVATGTGVTLSRPQYLQMHLQYLEEEVGKYPDKPDVTARIQQRIKDTKAELKQK